MSHYALPRQYAYVQKAPAAMSQKLTRLVIQEIRLLYLEAPPQVLITHILR